MRLNRFLLATLLMGSCWIATASDLHQIGMVNLPGTPGFGDSAFAGGMLLLTHTGASSIDVFDPVRRRVVTQIAGLQSPRAVVVDEPDGKVYVADHGSNSIAVVAIDGWKVVDSIPLPGSPDAMLLDGKGKLYWTDADHGTVSQLDLRTKQNLGSLDLGGTPRGLAFDSARKLLFVSVQDVHQVVAIDPQLKIVSRFVLNASQPSGLVYDPQFRQLYVAVRFAVLAISAETGAEVDRFPAPGGVDGLWLDPDSQTLFAASNGSLLMMQARGRFSLGVEIATQVKGHTVAYDSARRLVFLPGGQEGKSRMLIFRLMDASGQTGADHPQPRAK